MKLLTAVFLAAICLLAVVGSSTAQEQDGLLIDWLQASMSSGSTAKTSSAPPASAYRKMHSVCLKAATKCQTSEYDYTPVDFV